MCSLALKNNSQTTGVLLLVNNEITLSLNITLLECPPGHILEHNQCICKTSHFKGILRCDRISKTATINNGYWIGLCKDGEQCSGNCPVGFCTSNTLTQLTTRISETHKILCNSAREGKLCGNCSANHSVYYHSHSYRCGGEHYCDYGILFYILSEILPLTIIFIVIITFNISFTTGAVTGMILYAQILDSFVSNIHDMANLDDVIDGPTETNFHKVIDYLTELYRWIYEISNFNYLSIESLSFCLWRGSTTLDVIAWRYVTIVYAFFLIIATVFLLNTTRCKRVFRFWRPHNLRNAVIHGFTAFLVMCYSQCTKVSFQLLTITTLVSHNFTVSERVIQYSGEDTPFDLRHSRYGVPAVPLHPDYRDIASFAPSALPDEF